MASIHKAGPFGAQMADAALPLEAATARIRASPAQEDGNGVTKHCMTNARRAYRVPDTPGMKAAQSQPT
jgi:hypothetical protein